MVVVSAKESKRSFLVSSIMRSPFVLNILLMFQFLTSLLLACRQNEMLQNDATNEKDSSGHTSCEGVIPMLRLLGKFRLRSSSCSLLMSFLLMVLVTTSISFLEDDFYLRGEHFFVWKIFSAPTPSLIIWASFRVTIPGVLSKPPFLNHLVYYILHMNALICDMPLTLVETPVFRLVRPR